MKGGSPNSNTVKPASIVIFIDEQFTKQISYQQIHLLYGNNMVGNASTCLHNKYVLGVCKNIISFKLKRPRLRQASYATTDSLL